MKILAFKEIIKEPFEFNDQVGSMQVMEYPDKYVQVGLKWISSYNLGAIDFATTFAPYYQYGNGVLYIRSQVTLAFGGASWPIYAVRCGIGKLPKERVPGIKEDVFAKLSKLLIEFNQPLTRNTLRPEDVLERLP